jgi:hypothetical protein
MAGMRSIGTVAVWVVCVEYDVRCCATMQEGGRDASNARWYIHHVHNWHMSHLAVLASNSTISDCSITFSVACCLHAWHFKEHAVCTQQLVS